MASAIEPENPRAFILNGKDAIGTEKTRGSRKKRVLTDVLDVNEIMDANCLPPKAVTVDRAALEELPDNEFERERVERIRKNREIMESMQVQQQHMKEAPKKKGTGHHASAASRAARRCRAPAGAAKAPQPVRKSRRLMGGGGGCAEGQGGVAVTCSDMTADRSSAPSGAGDGEKLLDQVEYLQLNGIDVDSIKSDGKFRGWVSPEVCEEFGIPETPEQWEQSLEGGSKHAKIDKKSIPQHLLAKGWSVARAHSAMMLHRSPNTYFYRNVRPGEAHAKGAWTEEEHRIFLETARAHGAGNMWGLFASHLPNRVGYDCSAYYRSVMIPSGLILDPSFKMTASGKAVYVGLP